MQKMSEKEAIEWLKAISATQKESIHMNSLLNRKEALHMAIQALEEIQQYRAIGTVQELQKSVKEEDVLKFYYIESEDKYVIGERVDNFYYAEIGKTGPCFYMSRYLPCGKHVFAPETMWKEHAYPSEPKEIPFFDWLRGFIKKECGGTVEECRKAVERMKPKSPTYDGDGYAPDGTFVWDEWLCPNCGSRYEVDFDEYDHCPNCGQAILREEAEEALERM